MIKQKNFEVDNIERNYGSYVELIREVVTKKKEAEKNEIRYNFEEELSVILGVTLTKNEGEEFLNSISLSSKQKIITIGGDIKRLRKIYTNVLGKEYNGKEKLEEIIKK